MTLGGRTLAYWVFTVIVAGEMIAGAMWDLLRIEYVRVVLTHLGYPLYLLLILGIWKLPCGVVLLVPRFLRVKEWAYAGAFFNYSGAVASHLFVGDRASIWAWPLIFGIATVASWALRPPERRLAGPRADADTRTIDWIVAIVIAVLLLVVSLLTLPTGAPTF
jgi:DoxX-like family